MLVGKEKADVYHGERSGLTGFLVDRNPALFLGDEDLTFKELVIFLDDFLI